MQPARRNIPVIGLVGGVGSGKSHLAKAFGKRRSIVVVDGDAAGHQVLKEEKVKEQLRSVFGDGVFTSEGEIIRREVGRRVFGSSPEQKAARAALEKVVHPRITEILKQQIEEARRRQDVAAVLLDAAVLLEAGWKSLCDGVVFVEVPDDQRLERVRQGRGWTAEQLRQREGSQLPLAEKRKEADDVIDNSRSEEVALEQLDRIYSRLVYPSPT